MSDLRSQVQADLKAAMLAQDKKKLGTIRMLQAEIKKTEIDQRVTLDDAGVLQVIRKMIKQRKESISQFAAANRQDLVEQEEQELMVLEAYMPAQLSADEIRKVVGQAISTIGAVSVKDMGKVMGAVKAQLDGRADMSIVSQCIKEALGS